jgi:phospholipase C
MSERKRGAPHAGARISRRQLLKSAAAGAGMLAIGGLEGLQGCSDDSSLGSGAAALLPDPPDSGIEHIVLVMMENRSFDHFFGWVPGADGRQQGLTYTDRNGTPHTTRRFDGFQGCAHPDPDHSQKGGLDQLNGGACDGWLRSGMNDVYSIGYYTDADLAFYRQASANFTICDRYFAAVMASTFPNRVYQHTAQTDRLSNTISGSTLPTIWDLLANAGIRATYYFNDLPVTAIWGTKYLGISKPYLQFLQDAANGALPQVAFIDPLFGLTLEAQGLAKDDHPHSDIRDGQAFLNQVYTAIATSPQWQSTVLVINYDEWGGFFDHVRPQHARDANGNIVKKPAASGNGVDDGLRGFRVPCMVISPWSPPGAISGQIFDHTSVLRMIEWRWSLPSLTFRDATANNLAEVLDFRSPPNLRPPTFSVPSGPFGLPCVPPDPADLADAAAFLTLRQLGLGLGFPA